MFNKKIYLCTAFLLWCFSERQKVWCAMTQMNNEEILFVERLKSGEETAWRSLYNQHYTFLCNVADGFVCDSFTAESIVSDILFHLYEIRKNLILNMSLRAYLFMAVRNRCLNYLRQRPEKRLAYDILSSAEVSASSYSEPVCKLIERELQEVIMRAVDRLPDECRKVFCMSRFDNKTYKEIAAELGVSINTVRYHIKNALSSLHNELDRYLLALLMFMTFEL